MFCMSGLRGLQKVSPAHVGDATSCAPGCGAKPAVGQSIRHFMLLLTRVLTGTVQIRRV